MTAKKDSRWPTSLDSRNSFLLYVSKGNANLLAEWLRRLRPDQARSASAAIFLAVKEAVETRNLDEVGGRPPGVYIPIEDLVTRVARALMAPDVDDDSPRTLDYAMDELVDLLKPVLLAEALKGLRDSCGLYSLLGGRRTRFPWPAVKQAVGEMIDAAEEQDLLVDSIRFESVTDPFAKGEWRRLLRGIAQSPDFLSDPAETIADMRETLDKLEEHLHKEGVLKR